MLLEFDPDWVVTASMRDKVEVVSAHLPFFLEPGEGAGQFRRRPLDPPTPADFIPSNFTPRNLFQLLVIPRGIPGKHTNIGDLREAKKAELESSAVEFQILEAPVHEFPAGSFEVFVTTPYALRQTYTYSSDLLFVLTSGVSIMGRANHDTVAVSLSAYVRGSAASTAPVPQDIRRERFGPSLRTALADPARWGVWLSIMGAASLLALIPLFSRRRGALRLSYAGRSVIVGVNAWLLYALSVQSAVSLLNMKADGMLVAALPGLIVPWLFPAFARRIGGSHGSRLVQAVLFLGTLYVVASLSIELHRGVLEVRPSALEQLGVAFLTAQGAGVLFGLGFGIAYEPQPSGNRRA